MDKPANVDAYIRAAPEAAQPALREVRRIVLSSVPGVREKISYGMPAYEYAGQRLLHFAAARKHVGVYGLVHADAGVPEELARFLEHRSTLQFHFDGPLPADSLAAAIEKKAAALQVDAQRS